MLQFAFLTVERILTPCKRAAKMPLRDASTEMNSSEVRIVWKTADRVKRGSWLMQIEYEVEDQGHSEACEVCDLECEPCLFHSTVASNSLACNGFAL